MKGIKLKRSISVLQISFIRRGRLRHTVVEPCANIPPPRSKIALVTADAAFAADDTLAAGDADAAYLENRVH